MRTYLWRGLKKKEDVNLWGQITLEEEIVNNSDNEILE